MRLRSLAVAIAIVVPAVALGGSALADGNGQFKKVSIHYNADEPRTGGGLLATGCDSSGQCAYVVGGGTGATVVGDLQGDYVEPFVVVVPAGGGEPLASGSAGAFTGKVKRCGTGSFMFTAASTGTGTSAVTTYTIAPGTGTGDLVGITGTFGWKDGDPDISGWVRCKVKN